MKMENTGSYTSHSVTHLASTSKTSPESRILISPFRFSDECLMLAHNFTIAAIKFEKYLGVKTCFYPHENWR